MRWTATIRVPLAATALALAAAGVWASPGASSRPASAPAGLTILADFEGPAAAVEAWGAEARQVLDLASAAAGQGFLRIRPLPKSARPYVTLALPEGLKLSAKDSLKAHVRVRAPQGPAVLRWLAVDSSGRHIRQRRLVLEAPADWVEMNCPLGLWRWGERCVGDWSEVRSLAICLESPIQELWLDQVCVVAGREDDADGPGSRQWLLELAFADRQFRAAQEGDLLVATDATRQLSDDDVRRLLGQMKLIDAWTSRVFGDQVRPLADRAPVALLVFRSDRDWQAFYRRLGEQWNVQIAPPLSGGYTVQDISASTYDPMKGPDRPVYLHESAHAILSRRLRLLNGLPEHSWIQEGLANYLQLCMHPSSLSRRDYVNSFARPIGQRTLFRPLKEILGTEADARHYAQLASLAAFLVEQRPDWLRAIASGLARGRGVEEILRQCGTDIAGLEKLWLEWGAKHFAPGAPPPAGPGSHFAVPSEWQAAPVSRPASGPASAPQTDGAAPGEAAAARGDVTHSRVAVLP